MPLSWIEINSRAIHFSKKWDNTKAESAEAQSFLNDFFYVFGVDRKRVATFETRVPMGQNRNGFIDLLWPNVILVEMKSSGKNLDSAYQQAKDYSFHIKNDADLPKYIMISDFHNIRLFQLETGKTWQFKTKKLHNNIRIFGDLAGYKIPVAELKDKEVDIKAAVKLAKLHDILKEHGYINHHLELYLVRVLFCLFADDTGIFEKNSFFDYISNSEEDGSNLADRISRLFEVLNMSPIIRAQQPLLPEELKQFKYINGRLFEEMLPHADFDSKMRKMLLECCALDWGYISPAIFGSIFQGVMNPEERRILGAHYTSEENILKVIRPLFLDDLQSEFLSVKGNKSQLKQFHSKLSHLKFLDPACGCGNFLIISYRELRLLEFEVLKSLNSQTALQQFLDISQDFKVNVDQFYGIEIEEFPSQIAQVGLWLIDHQMNVILSEYFGYYYDRLPLTKSPTIINDNALTIDWTSVVSKTELSYVLGNPPFVGARIMNKKQKNDLMKVWGQIKNVGNLDYVTAWFKKSADLIENTSIQVALVSTNSITQGEQVSIMWNQLFSKYNIAIDFAYRTFKWENEARGKAAVHCVIIGFSTHNKDKKHIFASDGSVTEATSINPYLVDAENILVESRTKPICNVPQIGIGNMPIDGGNYLFTEKEKEDFLAIEPQAERWFRVWLGSEEFINGVPRYCLWLGNCPPADLRTMPEVLKRVDAVRKIRLESKNPQTVLLAEKPRRFHVENMPEGDFIIIPSVSSEKRKYVPIAFADKSILASNLVLIMPNASIYHFGILTSSVHMIWLKSIGGRLKSDYRYSANIVFNNFPWPNLNERQKIEIEKAAQEVIYTRNLFKDSSLADLYNSLSMPEELVNVHNRLDRVVLAAYGFRRSMTEAQILADLLARYHKLSK